MNRLYRILRIDGEREDYDVVIESVDRGVIFRGTNLWILVFAIFIASLGLNVNSTAVVIGAMLVSPLMGPIIGLGLGMAINDLSLLKKALVNYSFAFAAAFITSTVYFALSPLKDASTEILARTSPNIYDVLIAIFGGFAGILAVSSKNKGNVIPGVAIATALMPPLCSAGYGLANWNLSYLFGAIYLFVINTVFIAWATFVTARFLKFPYADLPNKKDEKFARRIVWLVVLITLLPSIYFGYDVVQQNRFRQRANRFIEMEASFPNDYLLKKVLDPKKGEITLTYGGEYIAEPQIDALRAKLPSYSLDGVKLNIQQGFSYLRNNGEEEADKQVSQLLSQKDEELRKMSEKLKVFEDARALNKQIYNELRAQYDNLTGFSLQPVSTPAGEDLPKRAAVVTYSAPLAQSEREKVEKFLQARTGDPNMAVYFEIQPPLPEENANTAAQTPTP